MGKLAANNTTLNKYFALLSTLDDTAKKKLIVKLTESLEVKKKSKDVSSLFGAWKDDRDSDDIIKDIRDSRVNSRQIEGFEIDIIGEERSLTFEEEKMISDYIKARKAKKTS